MRLPSLLEVETTSTNLAHKLEQGHILFFRNSPVLPDAEAQTFLRQINRVSLKNISYHPAEKLLTGLAADRPTRDRMRALLAAYMQRVRSQLSQLLPKYATAWSAGKVNWRPLQERGRKLRRHSSNELIHVDAFASGATHGARVLRFFSNLHPTEARVWRSAGTFSELHAEHGRAAGLGSSVEQSRPAAWWSQTLRGMKKLGLATELVDTSPYDRAMRRFHNYLKDHNELQGDVARHITLEFPPGSSWAVMTDGVSHACVSGQHALVSTFYIPLDCVALPDLAPFHIMRRAA